jgi:enolase
MKKMISDILSYEILDSRGNPTLETVVVLSDGSRGSASVPSGASRGKHEAHEARDGDPGRYGGRGVEGARRTVEEVFREALIGRDPFDQAGADRLMCELDGTENKSKYGGNATLSVSLALARAASASLGLPLYHYLGGISPLSLPVPMMNILNGGAHASNNVDIQEFMIVPHGVGSFAEGVRAGAEIYAALRSLLSSRDLSTAVGDDGGFAPDLAGDEEAIELLIEAIRKAGYSTDRVGIALDAAASEWKTEDGYRMPKRGREFTREELADFWESLADTYPILSLEDGLGEDDFAGWWDLTCRLGDRILLVGDDLFVTNTARLNEGIRREIANAILIKPNQIGTLTETLSVIETARKRGYRHILSHRSGDTPDSTIADLAVATASGFIKTGAPCRGERIAKYNRLLAIARDLGEGVSYGI